MAKSYRSQEPLEGAITLWPKEFSSHRLPKFEDLELYVCVQMCASCIHSSTQMIICNVLQFHNYYSWLLVSFKTRNIVTCIGFSTLVALPRQWCNK